MIAKVVGGTRNGGTMVVVECPQLVQHESGVGFAPCEAEIDVEQADGGALSFPDPKCPCCDTVFTENDLVREAIFAAALNAIDNYDGPPDDSDAWSGGFAANH